MISIPLLCVWDMCTWVGFWCFIQDSGIWSLSPHVHGQNSWCRPAGCWWYTWLMGYPYPCPLRHQKSSALKLKVLKTWIFIVHSLPWLVTSSYPCYWVLALTRGTLPNLVASCVPAGFPHVFYVFWYFWMWGDAVKLCVPAVFCKGLRC